MTNIIHLAFQGKEMDFRDDGWFNATVAAASFEKQPTDWLYRKDTVRYIEALSRVLGNCGFLKELNENNGLDGASAASKARLLKLVKSSGLVSVKAGSPANGGGTWLHPKLAVAFARWLSVEFEVWCDVQIENLIRGAGDHSRARHAAASSFKMMCQVLQVTRLAEGKGTMPHHYANESKLMNWSIGGEFAGLDRDALTAEELDVLAANEIQNAVMIGTRVPYSERKSELEKARAICESDRKLPVRKTRRLPKAA